MSVTDAVFQLPIGMLNWLALANIPAMFVTADVFHAEMSALNDCASLNNSDISVMSAVFH